MSKRRQLSEPWPARIYIPALLALALTTGMRHGDCCAWADQARLLDSIVATVESFALKRESSGLWTPAFAGVTHGLVLDGSILLTAPLPASGRSSSGP